MMKDGNRGSEFSLAIARALIDQGTFRRDRALKCLVLVLQRCRVRT